MRGAVTGGPVGMVFGAPAASRPWTTAALVRFRRQLVAQLVLGVRLLNGGAPDLVGGEEQEDDAGTDQDAAREVGRPAEPEWCGFFSDAAAAVAAASLAALRSARVCGAGPPFVAGPIAAFVSLLSF